MGTPTRVTVPEAFAVRLPPALGDLEAAPLLCAGVIGYRALRRAEVQPGERVALLGFGASAHLALQVLHHWGCEVVVMTRGEHHRELARELGASWVGDAAEPPPGRVRPRGRVRARGRARAGRAARRCAPAAPSSLAGIHMSEVPAMPYELLWHERSLRSVANMTRADAQEFMDLAADAGIRAEYEVFPLEAANDALAAIKGDAVRGAAVLRDGPTLRPSRP